MSSLALAITVALFALGGLFVLVNIPFPTAYDELQHVSFVRALREMPALYPAYGSYRVLSEDLSHWTEAANYLAHPPLYYLLLAPLGDSVLLLRAVNLLLATAGIALCAFAGTSLLTSAWQRYAYLLLLLVFSKPALIAGMVNNDNLVLLETGLLLWLLATGRGSAYALGAILAVTGWTKFNAFVGLALWVGLLHASDLLRGRRTLLGRTSVVLLAGVLVGAMPAVHNLSTLGTVAYVPADFLFVPLSERPSYDLTTFALAFFGKIGRKVLYMDGLASLLPLLIAMVTLGAFAIFARVTSRTRDLAVTAWLATLMFAALHLHYGWTSFTTLGSMSDAQSRYYVMLWPGFALAAVVGGTAIWERVTSPRVGGNVAPEAGGG